MGRPKKRILLIDYDELRQSTTRLVLEISGFRVLSASSLADASQLLADGAWLDLLLGYAPIDERAFAAMSLKPRTPAIFMAAKDSGTKNLCDATLDAYWTPISELLERIRVMAARKRGPCKGTPRPPRTVQSASVEACA